MFPFSVTHPRPVTQSGTTTANSGYELIAFDAEKLNVVCRGGSLLASLTGIRLRS
ncbi:two-component response regulator [Klebsiella michiganensis]|nr:two-component response regulator [Klebsiella michiganensis]